MALFDALVALSSEIAAAGIFVISVFLAIFIATAAKHYIKGAARKTETILDDLMIKAVGRPLVVAIVLAGLYLALRILPGLAPYRYAVDAGFTILGVLLAALVVVRVVNALIEWYARTSAKKARTVVDRHVLPMFNKAVYAVVYAVALLWVMNMLGIEITTMVAALGVGGIAIALALQDTLSNLFAGAYIALDRPIRIGDYVEIDDTHKGYVVDIGWRSTRIRMLASNYVVIPNSKMAESVIINYSVPQEEMSIVVPVGVAYGSDLAKVEKVTIEVAKKMQQTVEGAVREFEPFIRYNEFGDSNIKFSVILRVTEFVNKYLILHEFMKALKARYGKEGIEIAFPCANVYMRK